MLHVRTTTLDAVFFFLLSPLTVFGNRNLFAAWIFLKLAEVEDMDILELYPPEINEYCRH